jgi:arylsulfatase A-like enzyme
MWPQVSQEGPDRLPQKTDPNILILVFDTLSAKHVSFHGYGRQTTPNLARFAERATVYHAHYAAGNFTTPGTASLLTGTYAWSHRAFHLHGTVAESFEKDRKSIFGLLPDHYYKVAYTHNLLAYSLLRQFGPDFDLLKPPRDLCLLDGEFSDKLFFNDYNVAFWSEWLFLRGGSAPPSSLFLSLADRVRWFVDGGRLTKEYNQFPRGIPNLHSLFFILEDVIDWIKDEVSSFPQPFLGYFHLLPPHEPYTTRRDFVDIFMDNWNPIPKRPSVFSWGYPNEYLNRQRREYDEYLAYTDAEFGRLLDYLERSGVLDSTYVILTSDHGQLFERGIHAHMTETLYEPIIRVPLLISKPGQRRREDVQEPTSCVDLAPTLLQLTGQPIPEWCEGQILPTFGDQALDRNRPIFAIEAKENPKQAPLTKATVTMIKDQYKFVHYFGYDGHENGYELYNLANDPEELEDLTVSNRPIMTEFQEQLAQKLQQVNQPYI